ncbi:hypothetical protein QJS10_CPA06g02375 [Acorus calamus]|uniref:Uncharacterized protein n=1 Tax=Acorus calamus TaxID=4465 RepID=A0AAV9EIG3_ACOCL|nr:hypothetical protein QJS10_CPA06g02375 [Acorus calamus]
MAEFLKLTSKSSIQKTHYDTLSISEDATHDEVRTSYRAAILNSHPDKLHGKSEPCAHHVSQETFLKVQEAWEVLGDTKSRSLYDTMLQASRQDEVASEVRLEEMELEDSGEVLELLHRCRCGDFFSIDSDELREMGFALDCDGNLEIIPSGSPLASVILPCSSCSLKIRLMIVVNS